MATKICILNQTTNLIDTTSGVVTYTGSVSDANAPVLLNAEGALDVSFLSTAVATTSVAGVVIPDGTTITVSGTGVISAVPAGSFLSEFPTGTNPTTTFTLTHTPVFVFGVYKNGQLLYPGLSYDYTISGRTLTLTYTTSSTDVLLVSYTY